MLYFDNRMHYVRYAVKSGLPQTRVNFHLTHFSLRHLMRGQPLMSWP